MAKPFSKNSSKAASRQTQPNAPKPVAAQPAPVTLEWDDFDVDPIGGVVEGCFWDDVSAILGVLLECSPGCGFIVIGRDDQHYLQAAPPPAEGEPLIVEYRDGSKDRHFQIDEDAFTAARLREIFGAYFRDPASITAVASWVKMDL